MKKMMFISIIILAFMLIAPLSAMGMGESKTEKPVIQIENKVQAVSEKKDVFRVLDKDTGKIKKMTAEDYIFCVVAAEMPALYHKEALKAQAVASYTYACYKRESRKNTDYDITTDYTTDQSFKTKEKAKKDWGSKGEIYAEKIENAVKETIGQRICYNGKTVLSVYHALSCGQTYSAKAVWGGDYPYLQSVSSVGDKLDKKYKQSFVFGEKELEKLLDDFVKEKKNKKLISDIKRNKYGLVESVSLYGVKISGGEIRSALELPSTNFEVDYKKGKYTFLTYGYGHGVGMSQKGADYMAKQGYSYKQILEHYYTDCTVSK